MNSVRFAAGVVLLMLLCLTSALAGPPLVCHRFEIGNARSLPWTSSSWHLSGDENYDLRNLARDTLAVLDTDAPVLVRMETLRRATLYAQKDPQAAKELLTKLQWRASSRSDALAWFDFGYLTEAYNQEFGKAAQNPAAGLDGYSWVKRALAQKTNDAQMEFAAALITLRGPQKDHAEHTQKAITGAKSDPLLARNLAARFHESNSQTVTQLLTETTLAESVTK